MANLAVKTLAFNKAIFTLQEIYEVFIDEKTD